VVIDLRWNDGGSVRRMQPLLHSLIAGQRIRPGMQVFAITGPATFSAPVLFSVDLERHVRPVFVGEPAGGRPNSFGELRRFRLPRSGLEIRYSAWFYQRSDPADHRPAILPDVPISITSEDFRRARDPAIEAIERYSSRVPIADVLRPVLEKETAEVAIAQYRRIVREEPLRYARSALQLTTLGEKLLAEKRVADAVAILELSVAEYPYVARAHFVLGQAYEADARREAAIRQYAAAFELDRSLTAALDAMRKLGGEPSK
jgi:hypothetical protein